MAPNKNTSKSKSKSLDFKKTKVKVGKTKPKPANYTNTSFKAKRITIKQQSLAVDAPSLQSQFEHRVSLLSSSSDVQRKESLSWLETALASKTIVWSSTALLDRLLPLLQDANGPVRSKLVKVLHLLPKGGMESRAEKILLHIWAGMTSINSSIRASALDVLSWAIESCGTELTECRNGWFDTLKTYLIVLGWSTIGEESSGWSSNMVLSGDAKNIVKTLDTLTAFLRLGMIGEEAETSRPPVLHTWWYSALQLPTRPDPYRHLNLYGPKLDASAFARDSAHRREIFKENFHAKFEAGLLAIRKQAGETGRAAAKTMELLSETMIGVTTEKELFDSFMKRMDAKNATIRHRIWSHGFSSYDDADASDDSGQDHLEALYTAR